MLWTFLLPCFIDLDAVEKSTEFTFERALEEKELGIIQILASKEKNAELIMKFLFVVFLENKQVKKYVNLLFKLM